MRIAFAMTSIGSTTCTTGELAKRYGFIYVDRNDDGTGTGKRYRRRTVNGNGDFMQNGGHQ